MGQVRGMKVRSSVKKMCEGCKVCLLFPLPHPANWKLLEVQARGQLDFDLCRE